MCGLFYLIPMINVANILVMSCAHTQSTVKSHAVSTYLKQQEYLIS